jgi:hypothetical protein
MSMDIDAPRCSECGKDLECMGSVLRGAQIASTGSRSLHDVERDHTLYEGSVCFSCESIFCMECNKGQSMTCPKCGSETPPAYRKDLWKLSQQRMNNPEITEVQAKFRERLKKERVAYLRKLHKLKMNKNKLWWQFWK